MYINIYICRRLSVCGFPVEYFHVMRIPYEISSKLDDDV